MKTTCMLSLPFVFSAAVVAQADTSAVPISNLTFAHRTNLIDTDQSQTFETLSVADEFTRLPSSAYQTAGVYFITSDKEQVFGIPGGDGSQEFDDPTGKVCAGLGFEVTSCASGGNQACPYNDKIYDKCCDAAYKYTSSQCSYPKKLSADTCGGKYKCECDTSYYSYTSCASPKVTGSTCTDDKGVHYSSCSCPTGVSAPNGCQSYYASPCSFVCKTAKADNCSNRTGVQTPYGCEKYFSDCDSKCEKAYTDNCRNRIAVSAPNGCESYYSDCQSKCEIAKTEPVEVDNCDNRTAVDAPYGCKTYYSDCKSKCKTAYPDNCHTLTAASTAYGCETYYDAPCERICKTGYGNNCRKYPDALDSCPLGVDSGHCFRYDDCGSKVRFFVCDTYYYAGANENKTGCLLHAPVLYEDGTVSRVHLDKIPIGVVFDEEKRLAVAIVNDINKDGSETTLENDHGAMEFSAKSCKIPDLEVCDDVTLGSFDESNLTTCSEDGRANTDKILASKALCGETYAATACNLYEPVGCTKDFCKKGKWFLPTMSDLEKIAFNRENFAKTMYVLAKYINSKEKSNSYTLVSSWWSSTRGKYDYMWQVQGYTKPYRKGESTGRDRGFVIPVVKY